MPNNLDTVVSQKLAKAYKLIGIPQPQLVPAEIVFKEIPQLARVDVLPTGVQVVCSEKFRAKETGYPKIDVILAHEFGHIGVWGITGQERLPRTRLLDEGWASVIEDAAGSDVENIEQLEQKTKTEVRNGVINHPEAYQRCFEIDQPITQEESPGHAAESVVGGAFLLWVRNKFGNQAMIDLLTNSPWVARRNDQNFEPVSLKKEWEHNPEYNELTNKLTSGNITLNDFFRMAYEWEKKQLTWAILKATGMKDINQVKEEFKKWINES